MSTKTRRTFVFHSERDRDILTALDALGSGARSRMVREALRGHFAQTPAEPTLADIQQELTRLTEAVARLSAGGVVSVAAVDDDDDEFTAALLELGR